MLNLTQGIGMHWLLDLRVLNVNTDQKIEGYHDGVQSERSLVFSADLMYFMDLERDTSANDLRHAKSIQG